VQYLSEVAEVEAWINDKMALVTSSDYGKDEDASDRLLAKNKVRRQHITFLVVFFFQFLFVVC
jgi:hypothetical protein